MTDYDRLPKSEALLAKLAEQTRGQGDIVFVDHRAVAKYFAKPEFHGNRASRRAAMSQFKRTIR